MKKLWQFLDNYFLQILVIFLILFIPLYPKLPSIHIERTWVYVRLEDFFIGFAAIIWFIQLVRKKISIPIPLAIPFGLYLFSAFISLLVSLIFIGPYIANFFPHVAILEYLRRIEYIILFFIAFSTIRSVSDIKRYLVAFYIAMTGIILYGIGQRSYLFLWGKFPDFFEKYPFCFPSFQTGNEEFAKGIPLCLPPDARITSTFGGHYDLAAYLVLTIPVLLILAFTFKRWYARLGGLVLSLGALMLLIFTSSRVSFIAYIVGVIAALAIAGRKKLIIPVIIVSFAVLLFFSGSTAKRFLDTIRITSIVTNNQGQVVGETVSTLPQNLQKKISKNPVVVEAPPPTQNLPKGSSFMALPQAKAPVSTTSAVVHSQISQSEADKLKLKYGGVEISTVSGSFLIQKALVYDISFTTRFQAEWPNAWNAFLRNPPFGSGYSSITLATDGDYLRFLGESGFMGLLTFLSIFLVLGITLYVLRTHITDRYTKAYVLGLAGGVIGLLVNALFIDVFEASKVAENLWILIGIGAGGMYLYKQKKVPYVEYLKKIFSSNIFLSIYLLIIVLVIFLPSINNFFVGDDFTWLRWAATADFSDLPNYFINSGGFFYRPLAKVVFFFLYTFFSFQPQGYHLFALLIHLLIAFGIFAIATRLLGRKLWGFIAAVLFILLPIHGENVFWISTLSINLAVLFIVYAVLFYIKYRQNKSILAYGICFVMTVLALFSYELGVITPLLFIAYDAVLSKDRNFKKFLMGYVPFVIVIVAYLWLRNYAGTVAMGGDYAYNLKHLIPNVVGNTGGYIGMDIFAQPFVPYYDALRTNLKTFWMPISVGIVIVGVILIGILSWFRKRIIRLYHHSVLSRIFIFSILILLIGLLPFVGLGNISERYGYLSSVGFVLALTVILDAIVTTFFKDDRTRKGVLILVVVVIGAFYIYELGIQKNDWQKAGDITQNTLATLRVGYTEIPADSNIYFVSIPIKIAQAWVFPVGLEDGIWFVYREKKINIYKPKTLEEAQALSAATPLSLDYIFVFNKNGVIEPK